MASQPALGRAADRPENSRPNKKVKFSPQLQVAEYHAVPAQDTVAFHVLLATSAEQLQREIASGGMPFKCEFYNQVFGESEEINGYQGLQIDIWLAVNSYHCWVDIRYEAQRPGADDVLTLLQAWWPKPFTTDKQEFIQTVTAAPTLDFSRGVGTVVGDIARKGFGVKLYHSRMVDTPDWFKELHVRMEPLLIFTIDGANFLDVSDAKWEVVAAVMERDGQQYMVGYMMLYNFYAWPLNQRPRVAQILVLPPLQGAGIGKAMIKAAYDLARERNAVDLTFEEPAPGLQRLREKLEVDVLRTQPWVVETADAALAAAQAEHLKQQAAAKALYESAMSKKQQRATPSPAAEQLPNGLQPGPAMQPEQQPDMPGQLTPAVASDKPDGAATQQPPRAPAALLTLPQQLQDRITQELKIHKHQVYAVWEALLFLRSHQVAPGVSAAEDILQELLQEFVMGRLEATHAAVADKNAAHKKLVQVAGKEDDWFVYKAVRGPAAARSAAEVLLSDTVNVGRHTITEMSADDWSKRLQQLTAERLEQLAELNLRCMKE